MKAYQNYFNQQEDADIAAATLGGVTALTTVEIVQRTFNFAKGNVTATKDMTYTDSKGEEKTIKKGQNISLSNNPELNEVFSSNKDKFKTESGMPTKTFAKLWSKSKKFSFFGSSTKSSVQTSDNVSNRGEYINVSENKDIQDYYKNNKKKFSTEAGTIGKNLGRLCHGSKDLFFALTKSTLDSKIDTPNSSVYNSTDSTNGKTKDSDDDKIHKDSFENKDEKIITQNGEELKGNSQKSDNLLKNELYSQLNENSEKYKKVASNPNSSVEEINKARTELNKANNKISNTLGKIADGLDITQKDIYGTGVDVNSIPFKDGKVDQDSHVSQKQDVETIDEKVNHKI
ncbi:MAG: hypothetical protein ACERKK_04085 [Poseidonibacter sp.]|uniref:hypothetical protein n=1 Tax=Poseidonibacter sp. TaxID=2321188 RepID=UPI00359E79EC